MKLRRFRGPIWLGVLAYCTACYGAIAWLIAEIAKVPT